MNGEYSPEHDAYYPFRIPMRTDLVSSSFFEDHPEFIPFIEGLQKPSIDVPIPKWQQIKDNYYAPGLNKVMSDKRHPMIHLGVDPNFIPYEFFDTDGIYKGIASDYIRLISERTGLKMEAEKNLTWSEAYEKAVERKLDVLPCVAKIEDLFYKTVAVEKGSSHHSYLKGFDQIKLSLYPSAETALEAITLGKEDNYVGNLATSSYFIKKNGMTGLKYIKINTEDKQYLYFAIRKDWPELVEIINKGLGSITEEEKIAINNKWIGVENKADYSYILKIIGIIGTIVIGIFLVSFYWIIRLRKEVSERIKVQVDLRIAKEEAEEANLIKTTFLARMSHEIRTKKELMGAYVKWYPSTISVEKVK